MEKQKERKTRRCVDSKKPISGTERIKRKSRWLYRKESGNYRGNNERSIACGEGVRRLLTEFGVPSAPKRFRIIYQQARDGVWVVAGHAARSKELPLCFKYAVYLHRVGLIHLPQGRYHAWIEYEE